MSAVTHLDLSQKHASLCHVELLHILSQTPNLLIIQDLDGVCMQLVKDPLSRVIDSGYVKAVQQFDPHFYVLTNGEHIGERGVNRIIDQAFVDELTNEGITPADAGLYLPGLAAGGIQWQDRFARLDHPGVLDQELAFLGQVPHRIRDRLRQFFQAHADAIPAQELQRCFQASVLDNKASPTANLNSFYAYLSDRPEIYRQLQQDIEQLMHQLLEEAAQQGMAESFFMHMAPNLGHDAAGLEILRPATDHDSGTTDFQFMLRGAVKEAGVVAILNHYYAQRTGTYPLGEDFSARHAPKTHAELLDLVRSSFSPADMPRIVGVGDTVNSAVIVQEEQVQVRRGGSDRNFLRLVQDIGQAFGTGNITVYVDSSGGEVLNRKPVRLSDCGTQVLEGPCDPQDDDDPLRLNVVIPGGYSQYCDLFKEAAYRRSQVNAS